MNEKEIQSFSLETLLDRQRTAPGRPLFRWLSDRFARQDAWTTVNIDLFRYPTRLDAFAILFCSEGSITVHLGTAPPHARREDRSSYTCPARFCKWNPSEPESSVYTRDLRRGVHPAHQHRHQTALAGCSCSVEKQPCLQALTKRSGPASPGSFAETRRRGHGHARRDVYSAGGHALDHPHAGLQGLPRHRTSHRDAAATRQTSARSRNDEYFNQFMNDSGQTLHAGAIGGLLRRAAAPDAQIPDDDHPQDLAAAPPPNGSTTTWCSKPKTC